MEEPLYTKIIYGCVYDIELCGHDTSCYLKFVTQYHINHQKRNKTSID